MYVEAYQKYGSFQKAANALKVSKRKFQMEYLKEQNVCQRSTSCGQTCEGNCRCEYDDGDLFEEYEDPRNDIETGISEYKVTGNSYIWKRLHKEEHASCSFCPWNRIENSKAKPDRSWKRFRKSRHR